jgi:hypothetical protein
MAETLQKVPWIEDLLKGRNVARERDEGREAREGRRGLWRRM